MSLKMTGEMRCNHRDIGACPECLATGEKALAQLNEADSGIRALYDALGQIKGINSECERHKSHPWQLQCETCRLFVARELAFQGVRAGGTEPQ